MIDLCPIQAGTRVRCQLCKNPVRSNFSKICAEFASNKRKKRHLRRTGPSTQRGRLRVPAASSAAAELGQGHALPVAIDVLVGAHRGPAAEQRVATRIECADQRDRRGVGRHGHHGRRAAVLRPAAGSLRTVGSQAAAALGDRAKAGAKRIYEFLNARLAPHDGDPVSTASAATAGRFVPLPPQRPSQHTLKPADLVPAWRGPAPRRDINPAA